MSRVSDVENTLNAC